MSPKEQKFIDEYAVDRNATKAAARAGYSKKTARQIGSRLLSKVAIKTEIERRCKATSERTGLTVEKLDARLALITSADPRKFFNADGNPKPIHELGEAEAAALVGLDLDELFEGRGEDREQVGVTRKYKVADPVKAIDVGYRRLGKYDTRLTAQVGGGITIIMKDCCGPDEVTRPAPKYNIIEGEAT